MGVAAGTDGGVIVAIDGGNSKTDVAVVQRDGTVLATYRGKGVSHHVYGTRQAVLAIEGMVREALAAVDLKLGPADVVHTAAYLAGVDLPREQEEMMGVVVAHRWSQSAIVDNDTFALLRVGSPSRRGVAVVCGAGINCVAVDGLRRTVRFPSLGQISGDWGGGEQLGREVMWAASRAEDGRGAPTLLRAAVLRHFDAPHILQVVERFQFQEIPQSRIHELAPILFDVADADDEVAISLVERLADEIAAYALASLRRLELLGSTVPIVLGGGVLAARHPLLVAGLERRVLGEAPLAVFHYVSQPPIVGAILLGLDHVGATQDAAVETAVRACYQEESAVRS